MQLPFPPSAIEVGLDEALNRLQGGPPDLGDSDARFSASSLFRLVAFANRPERECEAARTAEAFVSGLRATSEPWVFILHGRDAQIDVLFGVEGDQRNAESRLRAAWARSEIEVFPGCMELGRSLRAMEWKAAASGHPATGMRVGLGRLVRSMRGTHWAWLVAAEPYSESALAEEIAWISREEHEIRVEFMRPGTIEAQSNPQAERYLAALRTTRMHREAALRHGGWLVRSHLLAESQVALDAGIEALYSTFAHAGETPQPFRLWKDRDSVFPVTCLNSSELAALTRPPAEDAAGYAVQSVPRFSVATPRGLQPERLAVGSILDGAQRTSAWFEIGRDEFCRHGFVAGTTGSGKSTTCAWLALQLWREHGVPFLVVEPGMNPGYAELLAAHVPELRILAVAPDSERRAAAGRLPAEPLHLHPLAIPYGAGRGEHCDAVCSLLISAFSLPTPMPNVLREALGMAYRSADGSTEQKPTFRDVAAAVDRVVKTFGYTGEVATNVAAGLMLRLAGLAFDTRGAVFSEGADISAADLVARPTIIELDGLADDDDKALALGILLLRLGQHWRRLGANGARLRHLTLIEESHCLLASANESPDREIANPRGRAVAMFCRMLAEARIFGAGFLLSEQIPSKLAPDVIKNTNIKIAHRLPAVDDQELFGGAMGLDDAQRRFLVSLDPGVAAVHSPGCAGPALIRVPNPFRNRPSKS